MTQQPWQIARTVLVLPLAGFLALGPAAAWANPELQEVVSGDVQMNPETIVVLPEGDITVPGVDVTNGSIGNYGNFDIAADEQFNVHFTDGDGGNHLARVLNGLETRIMGELFSNGHLYLANPA